MVPPAHSPALSHGQVAPRTQPEAPVTPPPTPGTVTRADVIALGRAADPWPFIPLAVHALTLAPDDHELRFLLAAAYAKLGLRTAALETLAALAAALGSAAQQHPALSQLSQVVTQLPDDRVSLAVRFRTLERNLDTLATRPTAPLDLRGHIGAWASHAATLQCFSSRGGNILFRDAQHRWLRFADDVALAQQHAPKPLASSVEPLLFDGIDPPWLFQKAALSTPTRADGQRTRLTIVEPDVHSFLNGLSLTNLQAVLADPRLQVFVGPNASAAFSQSLLAREEFYLGKVCFVAAAPHDNPSAPVARNAGQLLLDARAHQDRRFSDLMARGNQLYAHRDRAWWAERYRQASSSGPRLRVFIPTSRFTTFVQHSSHDLAEALRAAGCDVRVLIEPDDVTKFSAIAFWNQYVDWQPDLIIAINYTRQLLPGGVPAQIPFITWIQDQAAQLLRQDVGKALGEFDFVAGFLIPALFDEFGYPRVRTRFAHTPVSATKFHAAPVHSAAAAPATCDIAYVSNHSEPAESLVESLLRQSDAREQAAFRPALINLLGVITKMSEQGLVPRTRLFLRHTSRELLQSVTGSAPPDALVSHFVATRAYPLAERVLRHQMLAWAAELCEERGWKLNIYGSGWDKNPRFAPFACGSLKHGEDLRAAYQCARVHLHAGMGAPTHQRIMECALSGGATLVRLKGDDLDVVHQWWAMGAECAYPGQVTQAPPRWSPKHSAWTTPPPALPTAISRDIHARLGVVPIEDHPQDAEFTFPTRDNPWPVYHGTPVAMQEALFPGDPQDCMFWSRDTFRALATLAITNSAFRDGLAAWQRDVALARFTYESLAPDLVELVRTSLVQAADVMPQRS